MSSGTTFLPVSFFFPRTPSFITILGYFPTERPERLQDVYTGLAYRFISKLL